MAKLYTERLYLRPPEQSDAGAIYKALSNFEISKNLSRVEHPLPLGKAEEWIERHSNIAEPADKTFAFFNRADEFCGICAFDLDEESGLPELGYYVDEPFWGKGLMSEAASAAVDWLFRQSVVQEITSAAFEFNPASLAVQYKLGFRDVRQEQRICMARGAEFPIVVTSLRRQDFKPL